MELDAVTLVGGAAVDVDFRGVAVVHAETAVMEVVCLVAAGEADLYPRLGRTMAWDIAAGHAVLVAAGGQVRTLDGDPLRYGKPGLDNPHFYADGLQALHAGARACFRAREAGPFWLEGGTY